MQTNKKRGLSLGLVAAISAVIVVIVLIIGRSPKPVPIGTDGVQPSVMEYDLTQHEPIKFDNGIAYRDIKVESIIQVECDPNHRAHCVSYIKEEDGPHFQVGSFLSPYDFEIGKTYHNCKLTPDDMGAAAAVIEECNEIQVPID